MLIRAAEKKDLSRIAEIFVFNNRTNYFPIFKDEYYSFSELQVVTVIENFENYIGRLSETYVYDDGIIRGFITVSDGEIQKLYTDTFFQRRGIGKLLLEFAVEKLNAYFLFALEKKCKSDSVLQKKRLSSKQRAQIRGRHNRMADKTDKGSEYLISGPLSV